MDLDEEGRTVLGFWGLEEGSGTANGEKKNKKNKREKERRKKMVERNSSLKDSISTWIF